MKFFLIDKNILESISDILEKRKIVKIEKFVDLLLSMTETPEKFTEDNKASLINFSRPYYNPRDPLETF